jgi:hypothetical protein
MATPDQMKAWLDKNADKAGTPDFVRVTEEYNKQTRSTAAPDDGQLLSPTSVRQALADRVSSAFAPASSDPGGPLATAGRVITGAATGIPDIAIAIGNAGVRASGGGGFGMAGAEPGSVKEAPYVGPMVNKAVGVPELPPDASTTRRLLEGGGSALLGGGASSILRAAGAAPTAAEAIMPAISALTRSTVAPTVGSHWGGQAGSYLADKVGLDKETGALIGSIMGGHAGKVADLPASYVDWRFRGQGRDNAAEIAAQAQRQGVTPNAAMLGNDAIQMRERTLANRGGFAGNFTVGRRNDARDQIANAWDRMAEARGSTDATPQPGTIGYTVADVSRQGAADLAARSSRGQEQLQTRIGPRTDTDVSGILAAMEQIRQRTDPGTAAPIDARTDTLRQMLPRDPEGNVISTNVPYERVKDWRTALRERSQNYDPVPGRYAGQIYDATTGAMRDAGASQGVPPGYFDTVQGRTRAAMGEGGPHEQLTKIAESEPSSAYSYLKGGEQNPERLRLLQNTGNPAMDSVFGDYLRMIGNNTINTGAAPGPRQLATRVERMPPEALDVIGGPQRQNITDIAGLARAIDIPPSGNGLGRVVGGITRGVPGTLTAGELGAEAGRHTGIPGGTMAGRVAGYSLGPALRYLQARILQSDTARNALAGGARPPGSSMNVSDLVAAIDAANAAASQYRRPPMR